MPPESLTPTNGNDNDNSSGNVEEMRNRHPATPSTPAGRPACQGTARRRVTFEDDAVPLPAQEPAPAAQPAVQPVPARPATPVREEPARQEPAQPVQEVPARQEPAGRPRQDRRPPTWHRDFEMSEISQVSSSEAAPGLGGMLENDISMRAGAENVRPLAASGPHGRTLGDTAATRGTASSGGNETAVVIHAVRDALQEQGVPRDSIIVTLGLIAMTIK